MKSSGGDKKMVTVILLGASDGRKGKPTVVFKGKGKSKEDKVLVERQDVVVLFSSNAWMQAPNTVEFIKKNFSGTDTALLCWNSYRCHTCPEVTEVLKEKRLVNVILPGGTTCVLQTADVCWNSPFKVHLRNKWATWMREGDKTYTKGGNLRSPSKTQLVDMIVDAWSQFSSDQIKKSFIACGQGEELDPDKVLCLKEGRGCRPGNSQLKTLLALPPNQRNIENINEIDVDDEENARFIEMEENNNVDPLNISQ